MAEDQEEQSRDAAEVQGAAPDSMAEPGEDELQALREAEGPFGWQASEYVHHRKGAAWYAGLAAGVALLVGVAVLLHLWLDIVVFGVMAVAVVIYAQKPPRTMAYELNPEGLRIDDKDYRYSEFRSFGVLPDVDWHTIDFEPAKRFSPRITVLFSDDDLKEIVGHLELHLPRVDRQPDVIERATRYLRF